MSVHKSESEKRIKYYSKMKYTGRLLKVGMFSLMVDSSFLAQSRHSSVTWDFHMCIYVMVADTHQQRKYFPSHIVFVLFILLVLELEEK